MSTAEMPEEANLQTGLSRAEWLGILSRAQPGDLARLAAPILKDLVFDWLRPPQVGLAMVRGRAGGTGTVFNLGEMTLTRCSVRLESGTVGHGFAQGRNRLHAEQVALLDALLQSEECRADLVACVILPLKSLEDGRRRERSLKAAATKVEFFTMVRGENPK